MTFFKYTKYWLLFLVAFFKYSFIVSMFIEIKYSMILFSVFYILCINMDLSLFLKEIRQYSKALLLHDSCNNLGLRM